MTRPIARSANVTARTRRRQGTSALFRSALVMALVITCVLATPVVVPAVRSARAPGGLPASSDGGGLVAGHTAMSGLASGACMSFAPIGGAETFYDAVRPFSASNRLLATDLQAAVVAALGVTDRGIFTDDELGAPTLTTSGSLYNHLIELGPAAAGWVDSPSQMPGALVEPLFLTNPAEARLAGDSAGQQRIAVALQRGLIKFLSGA